jgi:hypothetical protein
MKSIITATLAILLVATSGVAAFAADEDNSGNKLASWATSAFGGSIQLGTVGRQ